MNGKKAAILNVLVYSAVQIFTQLFKVEDL